MHKPYEVLKGITLPGEFGMVSGRVYNYLRGLSDKIKPASCVTIALEDYDFGYFFTKVANFLTESGGVSIVVDQYAEEHKQLIQLKRTGIVTIFDSSKITIPDNAQEHQIYRVADSLKLVSEKSKLLYPNHIPIFSTWNLIFDSVLSGNNIWIDFSAVREPDELSSGKQSFMALAQQIYEFIRNPSLTEFLKCISDICATIKRGGFRRHGAVTASIKSDNECIQEFLDIPFGYLTHLKKGISITNITDIRIIHRLIECQNKNEIFFEKFLGVSHGWDFRKSQILYDTPQELRTNVCRGIFLLPDDQCLVSPVNLGMCRKYEDIVTGCRETAQFLVDVHQLQVKEKFPLIDKQIAMGLCGLANMLRNFGVSYPDFIDRSSALKRWLLSDDFKIENLQKYYEFDTAYQLAFHLARGIFEAAEIGECNGMRASIAIEPNESCSRRYKDYQGYDLCPNIDPPNVVPGIGIERRHSQTGVFDNDGNLIHPEFNFGTDIFPAQYLTHEQHFLLWDNLLGIIDSTGQGHSGSYEMWSLWDISKFLQWWDSSIKFVYYNRTIGTNHLVKGQAISARERMKKPTTNCEIGDREAGCSECD